MLRGCWTGRSVRLPARAGRDGTARRGLAGPDRRVGRRGADGRISPPPLTRRALLFAGRRARRRAHHRAPPSPSQRLGERQSEPLTPVSPGGWPPPARRTAATTAALCRGRPAGSLVPSGRVVLRGRATRRSSPPSGCIFGKPAEARSQPRSRRKPCCAPLFPTAQVDSRRTPRGPPRGPERPRLGRLTTAGRSGGRLRHQRRRRRPSRPCLRERGGCVRSGGGRP